MNALLQWARKNQPALIRLIRDLVECESPTDSPGAVLRCMELLAESTADIAGNRVVDGSYVYEFRLPGRSGGERILALGHADTVWPIGTLRTMKFRNRDGRLWGPGVLDMKAGLAMFVFAMRALRELKIPVPRPVMMLVNPDEETGSNGSRQTTESLARGARAVLVLEPGTGLTGKAKTARKGIGGYRVAVKGVAAHSGVDFENGASAIVELSRQIGERIAGFTDLKRGITVNPGVISGGTRSNVIAAAAETLVDIRVPSMRAAAALDKKFRALRSFDRRCSIEITGGLNRPPMERSRGIAELFGLARRCAAELGVTLEESATGGGSDGNFTAALGVPTLDGIGAVGEGAHAAHESVLVERLADRTALIASLVANLS
ncbi:MAG TPA: M20 family metallopeptidase [Bryobacteraceae bacterium]|nr:M20 family metallopeptidase [Bryobacteraceae bacterium]